MPERTGDHVQVSGKGVLGRGMHIYLNGQELKSCRYFKLELESGSINAITMELTPYDIDVDAEALAELVALVDAKRKREYGSSD